jgi:subtilisin family serine protease
MNNPLILLRSKFFKMKKLSAHSPSLLILFFCVIFSYNVSGQNLKNNPKSLPPINYSDINPESIEPGKFRIKFSADVEQKIASPGSLKSSAGTIITGLSEIDALHQKFNVNKGNALLSNLYDKNLKSISVNKKKHNHHGLHLWYEFEADETIDIKNIIAQYGKLKGVDIVEPVFKKVPILPVENPLMPNTNNASANLVELLSWMPEDERFDEQWHYHNTGQNDGTEDADIDLPEAWNLERGQPEVIVAVFDQGVDIAHPDLAANIWSGVGPQGANTLPGPHGTHVAGTIAAVNNNQIGVSGIAGGSGNDDGVRIMTLDIFSEENELSTLEMYVWAADNGAAISQNSWGYINPDVYNLSDLEGIDYFNEHGGGDVLAGGLTIFAAGNETDDGQWFPGCYEGTLAVAATNNNDQLAYYSNYGDWIDISAPGGETYISSTGVLSTVANNGYEYFQGTSMACPHVSGVAALVLSQTPGLLTNNELKSILTESSDNHYAQNPSYEGKLGNGRLNAYNALISAQQYMGDVINPTSVLAAGISETQIELQWMLNEVGDNVMIAFSEVPELGTPENGILYSPGDEIPGGGQVIYSGNNTSFITGGLSSNTIGYFRIWSYDAATEYSFGRNVQAFTLSPAMRITPDQLDFGFVYVGYPKSVTFQIQNEGTLDLVISDVGFSDNNFSSANSPTIIEPQATFEWEILFTPAQTGNYTGTLSFSSNDPEFQNVAVDLNATVSDEIPALDVQPAFLEASINAGESVIKTIELSNIGDGELQYSFHAPGEPSPAVEQKTYSIKHNDANITKKGETRTVGQYANRDKLLAGGSADAGYFFRTTSINWVDASNGTELSLSDDDFSSFIPLGFSFKYFGKSYNSINVMSNGWVSFTHTSEWFPVCIPDEGGAICPLGVDLSPDNSSKIRYTTQGTAPSRKFVVEYNNVKYYDPNITSTSTFQIVFYEASNSISFQYLNVSGTPLTVGLENEDGSRGIGNCGSGDNFLNPEIVTDNPIKRLRLMLI